MNKLDVTEEQLRTFANETSRILLELSDERIAEISIILNEYKYPHEFKHIYPFNILQENNTRQLNFLFWKIVNDFINEIVPRHMITKAHYRINLSPQSDWDFSFNQKYDITNEKIEYEN